MAVHAALQTRAAAALSRGAVAARSEAGVAPRCRVHNSTMVSLGLLANLPRDIHQRRIQ